MRNIRSNFFVFIIIVQTVLFTFLIQVFSQTFIVSTCAPCNIWNIVCEQNLSCYYDDCCGCPGRDNSERYEDYCSMGTCNPDAGGPKFGKCEDKYTKHSSKCNYAGCEHHKRQCLNCGYWFHHHVHLEPFEHKLEFVLLPHQGTGYSSGHSLVERCTRPDCGYQEELDRIADWSYDPLPNGASGHYYTCETVPGCTATIPEQHDYRMGGGWVSVGESGHQRDCGLCGYVAAVEAHYYGSQPWKDYFDDRNHYKICQAQGCDYEILQPHNTYIAKKPYKDDENHNIKCKDCSYTEEQPHTYDKPEPYWNANETYHFKTCTTTGCGHVYEERHEFSGDWMQLSTSDYEYNKKHYDICDICDRTVRADHRFGNFWEMLPTNNALHGSECIDGCGYYKTEPHTGFMSPYKPDDELQHYRNCTRCIEYEEYRNHDFREAVNKITADPDNPNSAGRTEYYSICDRDPSNMCGYRTETLTDYAPEVEFTYLPEDYGDLENSTKGKKGYLITTTYPIEIKWEASDEDRNGDNTDKSKISYQFEILNGQTGEWEVAAAKKRGMTSFIFDPEKYWGREDFRFRVCAWDDVDNRSRYAVSYSYYSVGDSIACPELDPHAISDSEIELEWTLKVGIPEQNDKYVITNKGTGRTYTVEKEESDEPIVDDGLMPNTIYKYEIEARRGGQKTSGNSVSECTFARPADPIRAEDTSQDSFEVIWSHNGNPDYTRYRIELEKNDSGNKVRYPSASEYIKDTRVEIEGINVSDKYTIYITAINEAGKPAATRSIVKEATAEPELEVEISPDEGYSGEKITLKATIENGRADNVQVTFDGSFIQTSSGGTPVSTVMLTEKSYSGGKNQWSREVWIHKKAGYNENHQVTFTADMPSGTSDLTRTVTLPVTPGAEVAGNIIPMDVVRDELYAAGVVGADTSQEEITINHIEELYPENYEKLLRYSAGRPPLINNNQPMLVISRVSDNNYGKIPYGSSSCTLGAGGGDGMTLVGDDGEGIGYFARIYDNNGAPTGTFTAYFTGYLANNLEGSITSGTASRQYIVYKEITADGDITCYKEDSPMLTQLTSDNNIQTRAGYGIELTAKVQLQGGTWISADIIEEESSVLYYVVENNEVIEQMDENKPDMMKISENNCMKIIMSQNGETFLTDEAYAREMELGSKSPGTGEFYFRLPESGYSPHGQRKIYPVPGTADGFYAVIIEARLKVRVVYMVDGVELPPEEGFVETSTLIKKAIHISASMYDDDETMLLE